MNSRDLFPDSAPTGLGSVAPIISTIDETAGEPLVSGGPSLGTDGLGPGSGYIGLSVSRGRLLAFFGACFLMLGGLAFRTGSLDLGEGDSYRALAEGNRIRVVPIQADRGVIYDREGHLLVRNIPDFTLTVTPADLPKDERERLNTIADLAAETELTPVEIEASLSRHPKSYTGKVPIKEHLDYDKAVLLNIRSGGIPGVEVILGTKREYLLTSTSATTTEAIQQSKPILSLSHLLGYEGRVNESEYAELKSQGYLPSDAIGKTGVEASYETELRGTYGRKQIEVDAFGREQSVLAEDDPTHGKDLVLSIDARLQSVAEEALRVSALKNGRGRGAVVAMDPRNGEILALVSLPSFDANDFAKGISLDEYKALSEDPGQPLYPRAISGLYPPGSTAKLPVAAAGLMEGVIDMGTTVISKGGIRVGAWFFPDWKAGGHGATGVSKAIAESVNTFFYAIGGGWENIKGLGVDKLAEYFRRFGLGSKLGIDLPGERPGFVPDKAWKEETRDAPWYIGDTYHMSIGQGDLLATPIQVAAWTAVFANGGDLVVPHVVKSIRSGDEETVMETQYVTQSVAPADIVAAIKKGMRQTVVSGSARAMSASPWNMAGKTGTAQWRQGEPNHAWFTGFAPYDEPQIVVSVLVEAGGEGSAAAAPVAREIMEAWMRLQKVKPDRALPVPASASNTPEIPPQTPVDLPLP